MRLSRGWFNVGGAISDPLLQPERPGVQVPKANLFYPSVLGVPLSYPYDEAHARPTKSQASSNLSISNAGPRQGLSPLSEIRSTQEFWQYRYRRIQSAEFFQRPTKDRNQATPGQCIHVRPWGVSGRRMSAFSLLTDLVHPDVRFRG